MVQNLKQSKKDDIMMVKDLKEKLNAISDDAKVVLYDGLDEGDVFCGEVKETIVSKYKYYCAGDSCTRHLNKDAKVCVLAGR